MCFAYPVPAKNPNGIIISSPVKLKLFMAKILEIISIVVSSQCKMEVRDFYQIDKASTASSAFFVYLVMKIRTL